MKVTDKQIVAALDNIKKIYLDYLNNYLTVEKIANDYGMPVEKMQKIIDGGRILAKRG